jgi:chromosome segregation ATPase
MTPVAELRQQLKAAEAEEQRHKATQAKEKIKSLTGEGASLMAQLEPLVKQINEAQKERLALNGHLINARNQIRAYEAPLDALTFPSEKDEHNRVEQLDLWKQRQRELLAKHEDCVRRESVRPQAVALQKRLEHIQFEVQNWTAVAEGRKIGEVEGGVYQGVEDFLDGSQVGPPRNL